MWAQGVHDVAVVGVSFSLPYGASAVYPGAPVYSWVPGEPSRGVRPGWGHYPEEWRQIRVTVVVENQGTETENFTVTTHYDNETIHDYYGRDTQAVINLAPGANITLTFAWDATSVTPCKYVYKPWGDPQFPGYYIPYNISAEASAVPGEVDTADNTLVNGTVTVRLPGDASGDGEATVSDLCILGRNWYKKYGQAGYDWRADWSGDGQVTVSDLAILGRHWYESAQPT